MKKILFALCMACALSPAIAQNSSPSDGAGTRGHMKMNAEERAKFQADMMQQKLSLTPDQYARILVVNTEVAKRRKALMTGDTRPDKAAFRPIAQYRNEQFATILTPAQMQQWKAFRKEQEMRRKDAGTQQQPAD